MNTSIVLALIGPNTTGIVHRVAQIAAAHDANWLSARMMNLAGQFAGIVHLEVATASAAALKKALGEVEREGMRVLITGGNSADGRPEGDHLRLELIGNDHPGIVRDVSGRLAQSGVSIESLVTDRVSGPHSGEPLFRADAALLVPRDLPRERLQRELESLAQDLMVDLTLDTKAIP
jgi:glycine cleavage system regulatory protein